MDLASTNHDILHMKLNIAQTNDSVSHVKSIMTIMNLGLLLVILQITEELPVGTPYNTPKLIEP